MWADFFVPAGGLSKVPAEGMFSVAAAVPAISAVLRCLQCLLCLLAFCVCNVCGACKTHLETYNHIQKTIHDK